MGSERVLITGGAGFIGSHLIRHLAESPTPYEITVFDSLDPQVHGPSGRIPAYLPTDIHFIRGDVRDYDALAAAVHEADVVFHLAASVGVAQSMYQIKKFVDVNVGGTANLLDGLVNRPNHVRKLVVASSMSIYGEGAYKCHDCGPIHPQIRMAAPRPGESWELKCPSCGQPALPIPTPESKLPDLTTIYAQTKKDQEDMCLLIGKTYGIDTTALRFFGTYGSHQALSNPYTGVCAIFSTAYLAGNSPLIYEDGLQSRDLVHVDDICQALLLSMEHPAAKHEVFNVGTGHAVSIAHVAATLGKHLNPGISSTITHKFRAGDVRHTTADISKIADKLGYHPRYTFDAGIPELLAWIKHEAAAGPIHDQAEMAKEELRRHGLI